MKRVCVVALVALVALGACSAKYAGVGTEAPADWILRQEQMHLRVDELLVEGSRDAAAELLRGSLDVPAPPDLPEEVRQAVRKDALFRIASIELDARRFRAALDVSDQALGYGESKDVFTVNVYIAKGRALEGLGRRKEAAAIYHGALIMSEQLMQTAFAAEGEPSNEH